MLQKALENELISVLAPTPPPHLSKHMDWEQSSNFMEVGYGGAHHLSQNLGGRDKLMSV